MSAPSIKSWMAASLCMLSMLLAPVVQAEQVAAGADIEAVGSRFSERFDGVTPDEVRRTDYGLYEVRVDDTLFYTDAQVSYLMQGYLLDTATRRNLTQERMEQLSSIDFDALPLDLAIKQVRGNGERRIAVFEDPNCGYCKQLRRTLETVDNVTVYAFLFPILSQDSVSKSQAVWCAKDPSSSWDAWMLKGQTPAAANCDAPLERLVELGKSLNVRGTPAIFFEDGTRAPGALPRDELLARLERAGSAATR